MNKRLGHDWVCDRCGQENMCICKSCGEEVIKNKYCGCDWIGYCYYCDDPNDEIDKMLFADLEDLEDDTI